MTLPLTRRIARTALLLAAGAAPVVGAAGAASAAGLDAVPQLPQLGALTAPAADSPAGEALGTGEATAAAATDTATQVAPVAPGELTGTAGSLLGGLPAAGQATSGLPAAPELPLGGLPLGGLGG
ncbi:MULTISPECIES: ATP-binding protein [unclassified Streptomyces]|uniref:ATP-binding protein n=1 Tax=unclassified Streptomyces TaxID=2593676 RepID=UPI002258E37C|nr:MULTISPECIES: ATP-binding protein [unclassified Streptomyces]MCX4527894.1 ATP-binding protein [Streptomyces sp. NBC_01551]MCX4541509.1 ATP-binding protein [Streptomyces sp. NBC_01565]